MDNPLKPSQLVGRVIGLTVPIVLAITPPVWGIEAGVNIDVHQDIPVQPFPNDFHIEGRLESGAFGGNWAVPPVLLLHVDDIFPNFSYSIVPDMSDPAGNWWLFRADWSLPPNDPGIQFCQVIHLGLVFDLRCHNVMIDLVGWWTRDGQRITTGANQGFWPIPGFRVDDNPPGQPTLHGVGDFPGQFLRIQNGNLDDMPGDGEIEMQVVQMEVVVIQNREELVERLGNEPFRELRVGGMQEFLPWEPILVNGEPISEENPVFIPPDSFFDVFFDVDVGAPITPPRTLTIPPGGFLIAREQIQFLDNSGEPDFRYVWEYHEAHETDLGDAPDSSNTWGSPMTTYPANVPANFPTVYAAGSPPHGPIHWQPRALAHLGPAVTVEFEADLMPDQDGIANIDPPINGQDQDGADDGVNVPLALQHCAPNNFNYMVTVNQATQILYVNVWFDWARNGNWDDILQCPAGTAQADEWAVQNQQIGPFLPGVYNLTTPNFTAWHPNMPATELWMRITLSDQPYVAAGAVGGGGRGPAGGYAFGETEDYLFVPQTVQPDRIACCLGEDDCVDVTHDACVELGGDPRGPGTTCQTEECVEIKWAQPPVFDPTGPVPDCFFGWDEVSIYGTNFYPLLADDWLCVSDRAITDVHWWGSYPGYSDDVPPFAGPDAFHLGIWTDAPAGASFSHPRQLIWETTVARSDTNEHWVGCDFHPDFMNAPDSCFRYDVVLPPIDWFWQPNDENTYWLSVSAIYDSTCLCISDVNGDGLIDGMDLVEINACFGLPANQCPNDDADINCDGMIDAGDLLILNGQFGNAGPGDPTACGLDPVPFLWGIKTRPHFYNDDAVRITHPPEPGLPDPNQYENGEPVTDPAGNSWDLAFVLTSDAWRSKWTQKPHGPGEGFDLASNLAFDPIKWAQRPWQQTAGVHAHDQQDGSQIIIADDWLCEGGVVTDFHWWGAIEFPGSGLAGFELSIHDNDPGVPSCLPLDPPLWQRFVPISAIQVTPTGVFNNVGLEQIFYEYKLDPIDWFPQETGQTYWFNLTAISNNPADPFLWIWQESNRGPGSILCPAAEKLFPMPNQWRNILWTATDWVSDMAFVVTSQAVPDPPLNRVVADDFTSDGRRILGVRWWGSYLDPVFDPFTGQSEEHQVDGWLITFHHAEPVLNPGCPPDLVAGDPPPTALATYFAPAGAVEIIPMNYDDCFDHPVYRYEIKLVDTCLLCAEADPRSGAVPGSFTAFFEERGFNYWIDIVAVVGARWTPRLVAPGCVAEATGHTPSIDVPDFWGWHTSYHQRLNAACVGEVVDFQPQYPECWNYGSWDSANWLCPVPAEPPSVNMAFELLSTDPGANCPHTDVNLDGITTGTDVLIILNTANFGLLVEQAAEPRADVNGSTRVTGTDVLDAINTACFGF